MDIKNFVQNKFNFEPDLYSKVDVNGDKADELWKYLKSEKAHFYLNNYFSNIEGSLITLKIVNINIDFFLKSETYFTHQNDFLNVYLCFSHEPIEI